jgi:pimeloyl-ACP methyl ester carboxylesterase
MSPAEIETAEEHWVAGRGGAALAVRVRNLEGRGMPVLAAHGLSSNARMWDGVATALAALGHPVAALDQRGHGRSIRAAGYDFATLTDDLIAVADALGWNGPVVAAGHGWGGNVVLELAARRPSRLAGIALVDGGTMELSTRYADWPTCDMALTTPHLDGTPAKSMERMLRLRHPDWPEAGLAAALADVEILPDGTVRPWLSSAAYRAILQSLWEQRPSDLYAGITMPVLLIPAGNPEAPIARFDTAKREELATAERSLATVSTHWIDGDHDLHAQHPDLVAALLHELASGSAPAA